MEWLGLVTLIGNVIIPPVFNLVKGWVSKGKSDTPEQTMSNLATTKPDVLPAFVKALADNRDSETRFFNRDVTGTPSTWVINLRACIRPIATIISFGVLIASFFKPVDPATFITCNGVIGNWLGTKIEIHQ